MRKNEAVWIAKENRWRIKVQVDGVRKAFYSGKKGKQGKIEAEQKADKFINNGVMVSEIRLHSAFNSFIEYVALHSSIESVKLHKKAFNTWILPKLEHRKVSTITTADWQGCLDRAYLAGRAKKTIQNIRGSITAFLSFCADSGIEYKPLRKLKVNTNAPEKTKDILHPGQVSQLLSMDEKDNVYIYAFQFLVVTGLRPSELCRLKEKDISDGVVYVRKSKTEAGVRKFYLNDYALGILDKQAELKRKQGLLSPLVFPDWYTKKELRPNYLLRQWHSLRPVLGTNCTVYDLKHTFVSMCRLGVPEELLKPIVGHTKNMDTYGVYGHSIEGEGQQVKMLIENSIKKALDL